MRIFQNLRAMVMTTNQRTSSAIAHQMGNLSCRTGLNRPAGQGNKSGGQINNGDPVVELRVHLKVCESCGCFWFRSQEETNVYCKECKTRLQEFPSPESRKRRGRPNRNVLGCIWAVAESRPPGPMTAAKAAGGAE
jgi:hypothetical protein